MTDSLIPPLFPDDPVRAAIGGSRLALDRARQADEVAKVRRMAALTAAYDAEDAGKIVKARDLARKIGVDDETVLADPDRVERLLQEREVGSSEFASRFPVLSLNMQDAKFVSMAKDDLGNLKTTEGFWDWAARSWQAGADASRRGSIGLSAMASGRHLSRSERVEMRQMQERAQVHAERGGGFLDSAVELVSSMWEPAAAGAAASATVARAYPPAAPFAGAAAAFSQSFRLEAGNLYADLLEAGHTPAEASEIALTFGTAIAAVDLVGLKAASKPARKLLDPLIGRIKSKALSETGRKQLMAEGLKQWGAAVLVEPSTEMLQEVIAMAGEEYGRIAYREDEPSTWDWGRAQEAFTHTFKGMLVLGGMGAGGHVSMNMRRAANNDHQARLMERAVELEEESKLAGLSPGERARFVNQATEGTLAQTVHVYAPGYVDVLQQMETAESQAKGQGNVRADIDAVIPGLTQRMEEASERGEYVEIPTGDFLKLRKTEFGQTLWSEHSTFDPDEVMTGAERKALGEDGTVEKLRTAAEEQMQLDREMRESAKRVEDTVYGQLVEASPDTVSNRNARRQAQLYRDFVVTQAQQEGLTPEEFYERYPLTVEKGTGAAAEPDSLFSQERIAEILASVRLRREAAQALSIDGRPVEFSGDQGRTALAGPDMSKPGRFRLTRFDPGGPVGHTEYKTLADAVEAGMLQGFLPIRRNLESGGRQERQPRGEFSRSRLAVILNEKADLSTFLHESAHYFWDVYLDMARQDLAREGKVPNARRQRDLVTLFDWLEIGDTASDDIATRLASWDALGLEGQRKHHESFAANFEIRLADGKAPTAGLQRLFDRFKAWLRNVYQSIRGELNAIHRQEFGEDLPLLTGEVRDVMDRMIAAEAVVQEEKAARGMLPLFQTQEESGMSDDEWEAYLESQGRADDEAMGELAAKTIAQMRWLEGARSRRLKEMQREEREVRKRVKAEVAQRVEADPVYRLMRWLRRGETVQADGSVVEEKGPHKLSADAVRDVLRLNQTRRKRRKRGKSLVTFVRERGGISKASWSKTYPGETQGVFRIKGVFRGDADLTKPSGANGMQWEEMAHAAVEAGYGPQNLEPGDPGINEWFVEALSNAANGVATYTTEQNEEEGATTEEVDQYAGERPRNVSPLTRLGYGKGGMLTKEADGLHPDEVAAAFGFRSGEGMLRAMLGTRPMLAEVTLRTDRQMLEEYGWLADPEQREAAVERALQNDMRARMIATEIKAVARGMQPTRSMVKAAKEAARQQLLRMKVGDIRPGRFAQAEARAGREARRAMMEGDTIGVVRWKQIQLVQGQLAKQAAEVREEVKKTQRDQAKFFKPNDQLAKTRDTNVVNAARAVLSIYGLDGGRATDQPLRWLEQVKAYDAVAYAELSEEVNRVAQAGAAIRDRLAKAQDRKTLPFTQLTLDEFRTLREALDMLDHKSRRMRSVVIDGKRQSIDGYAALLREQLDKNGDTIEKDEGLLSEIRNRVSSFFASSVRVERMMLNLDGGTPGVFTAVFRRIKDAGNAYRRRAKEYAERYEALVRDHDFGPRGKIDATEELGDGAVFKSKAELVGLLRHMGNDSNKRKALVSEGWAEIRDDGTLDTTAWDRFMARALRTGLLTEADMDLVQRIWDLNEELKSDAQKAHFENYGYYFREVPAEQFTVTFQDGTQKTYRGGYVPALTDVERVPEAARFEIQSAAQFAQAFPTTPRNFTKERNENYRRPLSRDLNDGGRHLTSVLRFVHMQSAVTDAARVLRHRDIDTVLMRKNRRIYSGIIDPWLNRASLQQASIPETQTPLRLVGYLSRMANMGIMFANVGNAMQNFTGLFTARTHVKGRHLLEAIWTSISGGYGQMSKDAGALSTEMANRRGRQLFEIQGEIKRQIADPSMLERGVDFARRNTYFLQQITQNYVDTVVWRAAHNQAIESGADNAEAVQRADLAVRQTQMANDPEDISDWEFGGALKRALFPFQSWFVNWANNTVGAWKHSEAAGGRVAVVLYGYLLPLVTAQLVSDFFNGRLEDEDDDGYGDDIGSMALRSIVSGTLMPVPVVGKGLQSITAMLDDEAWNDRMPAPPFVTAFENAKRATRDILAGEADARDVGSFLDFFGIAAGVPIGAVWDRLAYGYGVATGTIEPDSGFDAVRGVVTGR